MSNEEGLATFLMYKVVKDGVSDRHLEYTSDFHRFGCFPLQKKAYTIKGRCAPAEFVKNDQTLVRGINENVACF